MAHDNAFVFIIPITVAQANNHCQCFRAAATAKHNWVTKSYFHCIKPKEEVNNSQSGSRSIMNPWVQKIHLNANPFPFHEDESAIRF